MSLAVEQPPGLLDRQVVLGRPDVPLHHRDVRPAAEGHQRRDRPCGEHAADFALIARYRTIAESLASAAGLDPADLRTVLAAREE